ncbi:MAG: 2-phosphosulfolactate phosphatase [Salinibacterium sp.]|nr:2-phosphosulfolactate phosphatase [Salinibacterium sp.]
MTSSPRNQPQYQVRFDWGIEGANALAPGADILIWVDALPGGDADPSTISHSGALLAGSVGSRTAVAAWVLARQVELGDRATVAVVAAGGAAGRFAVEDLLAAGAIIDAIAELGIDYLSPEAAAAVGAFAGLRNATGHVLSACVTGQELLAAEGREPLDAARAANDSPDFVILREFSIRA